MAQLIIEEQIKGISDPLERPEGAPILRAIEQAKRGDEVTELCFFCQKPLSVTAGGAPPDGVPTSFRFSCPCGRSDGFLYGI